MTKTRKDWYNDAESCPWKCKPDAPTCVCRFSSRASPPIGGARCEFCAGTIDHHATGCDAALPNGGGGEADVEREMLARGWALGSFDEIADELERLSSLARVEAFRAVTAIHPPEAAPRGEIRDVLVTVLREARTGTVELAIALGVMGPNDFVGHDHEGRIADALLAAPSAPAPDVTEAMVEAAIAYDNSTWRPDGLMGDKALAAGREFYRGLLNAALAAGR